MTELQTVIDILDKAADSFDSIANAEQKKIYEEVLTLAKDLETDSLGKVKQSIANLKRLTQIKTKLAALSKDKEWVAGLTHFAQYFGILQKQQNAYFADHFPSLTLSKTAKEKHELQKQLAVQNTMEALMGDGLKANVTDKLNDILLRAVTTNAKFADLQEELRAHLLGKDGGQGAFARYATTYATTALSQFTGQNNKLLTDDLDCEWFMYTGSNKETTREFCQQLTAKKFIHKSEIPTILQGRIDDYQCAIYPKTGLPYGMIEGTTPENFQCNCGGWNCRHQLVPVADALVPAALRAKFAKAKPAPATEQPQTIDIAPYQEQISTIEQYIADHPKSAKIKGYLSDILKASNNGNEEYLQALLQAAKKDIAKFNAAKNSVAKKKAAIEQAKADKLSAANAAQLQAAKDYAMKQANQYGSYVAFADLLDKQAQALQNGNPAQAFQIADLIDELAKSIAALKNIIDPMALAKDFTFDQLAGADKYVSGHLNTWGNKGKTGSNLIQAIEDEINKYMDKSHPTYNIVKKAFEKKTKEIEVQIKKDEYLQKKWKVTDYIQAHPKAGKVIQCFEEMKSAEAKGDMVAAGGYADNALAIIKKNEGVAAYLQKKKQSNATEDTENLNDLAASKDGNYYKSPVQLKAGILKVYGKRLYDFCKSQAVTDTNVKKIFDKYIKEYEDISNPPVDWNAFEKAYSEAEKVAHNKLKFKIQENSWQPEDESLLDYYNSITKAGHYSTERKQKAALSLGDQQGFDYTYDHTNFRNSWKKATKEQKQASESYTHASGSITKLLRGINGYYEKDGYYADKSEKEAKLLTELIAKTTCQTDVFIKRDEIHAFCDYRWNIDLESYRTHMQDLIGKVGKDESFISCGNNTSTYFTGTGGELTDVELRIFCPKGTQMLPEEPQGHYSQKGIDWNGNDKPTRFSENEIILQRGTKLRITDARYDKKKKYYYIACEVISQNPRDFRIEYTAGQGYKAVYN